MTTVERTWRETSNKPVQRFHVDESFIKLKLCFTVNTMAGVRDPSKLPVVYGSWTKVVQTNLVDLRLKHTSELLPFISSCEKQHYVTMQHSKQQWDATVTVEHQSPIFRAACFHTCRSSMRIRAVLAKDCSWIFCLDRLNAQNPSIWSRILWTHSMHSISHVFFHYDACLVLCLLAFSVPCLNTLTMHTTNQLTANVANNCHCTSHKNGEIEVEMVRAALSSNRWSFQHPDFVGNVML